MAEPQYVLKEAYDAHMKACEVEHQRLRDEDLRQNDRLDELEKAIKIVQDLTLSVNTLAVNMDNMLKELQNQGARVETLEKKDGDMWRTIVKCAITGLVTLVVGLVFGKVFS